MESESSTHVTLSMLFSKKYIRRFVFGFGLNIFNQLTGINVFGLYSTNVYEEVGFSNAKTIALYMILVLVVLSIIVVFISEKCGRKTFYQYGLLLQGIFLITFVLGFRANNKIVVLISNALYFFGFIISGGAILYPYCAEVLPPIGLSLGAIGKYIIAMAVAKFSLDLKNEYGIEPILLVLAGFSFIGFFFVLLVGVET